MNIKSQKMNKIEMGKYAQIFVVITLFIQSCAKSLNNVVVQVDL